MYREHFSWVYGRGRIVTRLEKPHGCIAPASLVQTGWVGGWAGGWRGEIPELAISETGHGACLICMYLSGPSCGDPLTRGHRSGWVQSRSFLVDRPVFCW